MSLESAINWTFLSPRKLAIAYTAIYPYSAYFINMATKTTFTYKWGEITIFNRDNYSKFSDSYMLAFIAIGA
jgi:hypothetical protein